MAYLHFSERAAKGRDEGIDAGAVALREGGAQFGQGIAGGRQCFGGSRGRRGECGCVDVTDQRTAAGEAEESGGAQERLGAGTAGGGGLGAGGALSASGGLGGTLGAPDGRWRRWAR